MSVSLSLMAGAGWQFFDDSGNPLTGGLLYTYLAGTTTPATTYTSSTGLVANSNPIVLNSAGRVPYEIWLTSSISYKFVLKNSSDVLIGTYDDITGSDGDLEAFKTLLASSSGSTLVGTTYPGSNVTRTVAAKLNDYVSAKDFGFATTNTAAANKTALEAAIASSDVIFIPTGNYPITGPIDVTNKQIHGAGMGETILTMTGTNTQTTLFYNNKTSSASWGTGGSLMLTDMTLQGNWDGSTALTPGSWNDMAAAVKWGAGVNVKINDVQVNYWYGHGVSFYRLGYSYFRNCNVAASAYNGMHFEAPSGGDAITSTWVTNATVNSNGRAVGGNGNIYIKNGVGFWVENITFEDSYSGLYIDGADNRNVTVITCHCETCPSGIINYVGSGINTCLIDCFADAAISRSQPQFQTMIAYGNSGGALNAIEQEWRWGNSSTNNTAGIQVDTNAGAAYLRVRGGHPGYFGNSYGYLSPMTTTNQYGDTGPRMYARAFGNVNEDKTGIAWTTRVGSANTNTDQLILTSTGILMPANDGTQDFGSLSFYNGTSSVPFRWKDICATNGTIQTSDEREKTDISDTSLGLSFIEDLRPVSYKWKNAGVDHVDEFDADGNFVKVNQIPKSGKRDHQGLIAQEVAQVLEKHGLSTDQFAGFIHADPTDPESAMGLRYAEFIAPLIKAVQELSARVKELENNK